MSNKKKYGWAGDGSYLPNIEPYAKAKHLVLQEYVKNWIEVLCGHGKFGVETVTLVDGFCGGGMYRDNEELWEGSPIRMIRMVEEGLKTVRARKEYHKLDAKFFFIDDNKEHTDSLRIQIKKAGLEHYLESGQCQIITNGFEDELGKCIDEIRRRRGFSFFFLDPFGLDVTPAMVRQIISLGKSEVLLTHMLSGLVRILSGRDKKYIKFFQDFEADEYYREIADTTDFLTRQAYLRNQGLLLYRQEGYAKYAWTFAIMNSLKTVLYYLIHLSSNPMALEVMKQTLLKYNNLEYQFHYEVYGLGFREIEYYEKNLTVHNISEKNIETCINDLTEQLMKVVYDSKEAVPFQELYLSTMQQNAATRPLYLETIAQQRIQKEVKVIREGKLTTAVNLRPGDLIIRAKDTPIWIPGLPTRFEQEISFIKNNRINKTKIQNPKNKNTKTEGIQLEIPGFTNELNDE
jgi:three-Cys-motif partner protein